MKKTKSIWKTWEKNKWMRKEWEKNKKHKKSIRNKRMRKKHVCAIFILQYIVTFMLKFLTPLISQQINVLYNYIDIKYWLYVNLIFIFLIFYFKYFLFVFITVLVYINNILWKTSKGTCVIDGLNVAATYASFVCY